MDQFETITACLQFPLVLIYAISCIVMLQIRHHICPYLYSFYVLNVSTTNGFDSKSQTVVNSSGCGAVGWSVSLAGGRLCVQILKTNKDSSTANCSALTVSVTRPSLGDNLYYKQMFRVTVGMAR